MYDPVQDGIEKSVQSVQYVEAKPSSNLIELVHCFWELKTVAPLAEDFTLHALPDACVDIMFNEIDTSIAGVTALRTTYEVLNLGRSFHYVGIQFLPGVWQGNRNEIADQYIGVSYTGNLPLIEVNDKMAGLDFVSKQSIMVELVQYLIDKKIVVANDITAKILAQVDDIHSITDMADIAGLSPRQLQRVLKQITGFSPHDFLKVLRLQQAIKQDYQLLYTDQPHFIRSFRAITGYTPAQYFSKFDV
jgi:AraC-like DNA-binding protein